MYIIAQHQISDPQKFWDKAKVVLSDLPAGLKFHQTFPNKDGNFTLCVWEADSVEQLQRWLDDVTRSLSTNTYYEVDAELAMGLPASAVHA